MNRRAFLSAIAAAVAGAAVDLDRLSWVPGRKLISVPPPRVPELRMLGIDFDADEYFRLNADEFLRRYVEPAIRALVDRIEREMFMPGLRPRFLPLELPRGIEYAAHRRLENGIEARLGIAYDMAGRPDFSPGFVGRVDALVLA